MRKLSFISLAFLSLFSFKNLSANFHVTYLIAADTVGIVHIKDGLLNEWPLEKFTKDEETGIQYAIDNDRENLYIALRIFSQAEQIKMMRLGMRTFFDVKAKHKENYGVEFPLKKEFTMPSRPTGTQENNQQGPPDLKQMRMRFSQSLLGLKLFGFTDEEPAEQSLEMDNSLQITFSWDSTEAMLIEYLIPLQMLDSKTESLANKQISIGWKINGVDSPGNFGTQGAGTTTPTTTTTLVGVPAGSGPPGSRNVRSGSRQPQTNTGNQGKDKMMKEQEIWAKYTIQ